MTSSNGPRLLISLWVITGVALVFLVLRIWLKRWFRKRIGWDDYLLGLSWFLLITYTSLITVAASHGLGQHLTTISPTSLTLALKYLTIGEFFAILALSISKTSFAVTLLRFAAKKWLTWVLWLIIISLNIVMGMNGVVIFVSCTPVQKVWNPALDGKCWSPKSVVDYSIFAGAYSAAMDFALSAIPLIVLYPLRIDRKEKVGVCVAMSLGILAGIAAAVKTYHLPLISRSGDVTYQSATLLMWAGAESAITVIATSIPYFRLVLKAVRSRAEASEEAAYPDVMGGRRVRDVLDIKTKDTTSTGFTESDSTTNITTVYEEDVVLDGLDRSRRDETGW